PDTAAAAGLKTRRSASPSFRLVDRCPLAAASGVGIRATHCERGGDPRALPGTPNADSALLSNCGFRIAVGAQISPVMCGAHRRPRCGQPPPDCVGTPVSPMPPVAVAAALAFSPGFWPDAGGFWPQVRVLGAAGEAGLGDEPELAGAGDGLGAVGRAELAEHVGDVFFDGGEGDHEVAGDPLVGC